MKIARSGIRRNLGQTSIEMLVIIGVALLAVLVFFMLTQSQGVQVSKTKISTEATNTVSDLVSAAKEVYAQGVGAKKQVYVTIPQGYEQNESFVGNKAIKLRAAGNDYVQTVEFDVHGSLPSTSGSQWVWVVSEGNRVRIGRSMIEINRQSINLLVPRESTRMEGFSVKSTWDLPINISINKSWNNPDVGLSLDKVSFSLSPLSTFGVSAAFTPSTNASGFNSGYIELRASDGLVNETVAIPVTVEVKGNGSVEHELMIAPGTLNATAKPGAQISKVFQICTKADLSSVVFNVSAGDAGEWVSGVDPLGKMERDSCQPKTFSLIVPQKTADGLHTGYIYGTGIGSRQAKDSVNLIINVSDPKTDFTGPNVTNITHYPEKVYTLEPLTISALAIDPDNSSIKSCEISLDSKGSWNAMDPVDGKYDKGSEKVRYVYFPGVGMGSHIVYIRCSDSEGNSGKIKEYSFSVMKEILFVTQNLLPKTAEQNWISWISTNKSGEGLTWDYDVVGSSKLINSKIDPTYYSVIVFADWTEGLKKKTDAFAYLGGYVVLLGDANEHGPRKIGYTDKFGELTESYSIMVLSNSSYITEPLETGLILIANDSAEIYYVKDFSGTKLATDGINAGHTTLGIRNQFIIWGAVKPSDLNWIGANISTRVLDHAILKSTIKPG